MTAVAERTAAPAGAPSPRVRFGWAVTDTLTITRRNLLVWMRSEEHTSELQSPC